MYKSYNAHTERSLAAESAARAEYSAIVHCPPSLEPRLALRDSRIEQPIVSVSGSRYLRFRASEAQELSRFDAIASEGR